MTSIDKKKSLYFSYYSLGVAGLFLALFFLFDRYSLVLNTTDSYPLGIYQKKTIDRDIQRGDLVMFCLPDDLMAELILDRGYLAKGSCDSELIPLIKTVFAVAGDKVIVSEKGVSVNGPDLIENTTPIIQDVQGRNLPIFEGGVIEKNHYAVFSTHHPRSFDSRYFGAIDRDDIDYLVEPLWILGAL